MCGIAGYLNLDSLDASRVVARIAHRGPDGNGAMPIAPGSQLLHARLSIIDLSDAGRQPMRDPASGNVVVFNGEIYNYRDLRRDLDDGEPWQSHSDTEVILRAFRRFGVDAFSRLRGMFALAIWDASRRELVLARDRFGIKPLYFARRGRSFAFASELRALLETGIVERTIDRERLGEYLRFQSAVGAGCLIAGVEMLEAGGWLRVSEEGEVRAGTWAEEMPAGGRGDAASRFGVVREGLPAGGRRSSRPEAGAPAGETPALLRPDAGAPAGETPALPRPEAGAPIGAPADETPALPTPEAGAPGDDDAARVAAAFDDAVRVHLEADVPIGAFLSGGLDSTAIVGTMRHLGVTPRTFTVCFGEFDESVEARATARSIGAEHHEVTLSHAEVLAMVPEAVAAIDSPSADGVNSYIVSRAVRGQGLKVALSGLGGDELFGGYPGFARARSLSSRILRATPRMIRAPLGAFAAAAAGWSTTMGKAGDALAMPGTLTDLHLEGRALFSRRQVERLTGVPPAGHPMRERLLALERSMPERPLTFISIAEMSTYMRDTLLRDTDQMSMATGLEVRVPFLDGEFARTVLALPDEAKFGIRNGARAGAASIPRSTKPLLVEAFADRIPPELHALPKRGFSLPMRQWMRGPLREFCLDRLRSSALRDAGVDPGAAMAVWSAFEEDRAKWSRPWALVVLADWMGRR